MAQHIIPAYQVIDASIALSNNDAYFWWRTTGYSLAVLLEKAGYSVEVQYANLLFYHTYVVPPLGPRPSAKGLPQTWKSFMTDDSSPLELSWNWGSSNADPVIRYSIEPISYFAGTAVDPHNLVATTTLIQSMHHLLPDVDLQWYNHFASSLLAFDYGMSPATNQERMKDHASHTFVAFDLEDRFVRFKAYFLPTSKAREGGKSNLELMSDAISDLLNISFPSFDCLLSYISGSSQNFTAEILGLDCIAPEKSRLKIYLRSRSTSFAAVRSVMTLGGKLPDDKGIAELRKLWTLVLNLPENFSDEEELGGTGHRTGGILYYVEMKPGSVLPVLKIYIPVRHYGQNDAAITQGVVSYLRGRDQSDSQLQRTNDYVSALSSICPVPLSQNVGAQTYVSCVIKKGVLGIISYISPEVYKHSSVVSDVLEEMGAKEQAEICQEMALSNMATATATARLAVASGIWPNGQEVRDIREVHSDASSLEGDVDAFRDAEFGLGTLAAMEGISVRA